MKSILLLGAHGRLGAAIARQWSSEHSVTALARPAVDLGDPAGLVRALHALRYDVLVNATGMTSLEQCEDDPATAHRVNAESVGVLALEAARLGARLVHFSTDYVLDGRNDWLCGEEDPPRPQSVYAASKLAGEQAVRAASPDHLVVRVSWVFGPDKRSFVDMLLRQALEQDAVAAVADKTSSPAYTADIASWVLDLVAAGAPGGLYHACNAGVCSWQGFGQAALDLAAQRGWPLRARRVDPLALADMAAFRAVRPRHTAMDCTKLTRAIGRAPSAWQDALARYFSAIPVPGAHGRSA